MFRAEAEHFLTAFELLLFITRDYYSKKKILHRVWNKVE